MNMSFNHLVKSVYHFAQETPLKGALYAKDGYSYRSITYEALFEKIVSMALSLSKLGVQEGDFVAIMSGNRPAWVVMDMAALLLGAATVPLYPTLGQSEVQHILQDCKAKAVFCETDEHLALITDCMKACPSIHTLISLSNEHQDIEHYYSYFDLLSKGEAIDHIRRSDFVKGINWNRREDLASIVYTSGTTGSPKGVMLTHGNFLSNIEDVCQSISFTSSEVVLSFLPLSHVFERMAGYYLLLIVGGSIYYAEDITTVSKNMLEVKPSVLISVPRLYEKIHASIYAKLSGLKKPLFLWALSVGKAFQAARKNGGGSLVLSLRHRLADALVFRKVRAKTGGRLRFFISGGAPLPGHLGSFFEAMGLVIVEGYGQTEAAPVISCNHPEAYKFGSVGKALPRVEVKLADDGELLARGPNIMSGYYNCPEKTAETLTEDGWLKTGDVAEIDKDGYIYITDRKKEMLVLSTGKKVFPQVLEQELLTSRYISQVMVVGDNQKYLSALLVPNFDQLKQMAAQKGWSVSSLETSVPSEVTSFYMGIVRDKLKEYADFQTVKCVAVLPKEFSQEAGELTPTLKLRRKEIVKQYAEIINGLYQSNQRKAA